MNNSQISILPYLGKSPQFDHTVFIADGVRIIGDVTLGSDVSVWFNTVIRGDVNFVRIGDACNIQDNSCLHVENGICPLILGKGITVGHQVVLHGCTIGDYCLIGMGAIIMNHCEIGEESIIGAGCLVPEHSKIPPRSLVIGMPGKVKRQLTEEEVGRLRHSAQKYVGYAANHRASYKDFVTELKKQNA